MKFYEIFNLVKRSQRICTTQINKIGTIKKKTCSNIVRKLLDQLVLKNFTIHIDFILLFAVIKNFTTSFYRNLCISRHTHHIFIKM